MMTIPAPPLPAKFIGVDESVTPDPPPPPVFSTPFPPLPTPGGV